MSTAFTVPSGYGLIALDDIDSTNAEARRAMARGEQTPFWVVARRQSAGRGRRGRSWTSDPGNLFATSVVRLEKPLGEAAQLSFVTALAVFDTLASWVPAANVSLKWPNDVLLNGKKISGILLETLGSESDRSIPLAVGIGINLAHAPVDTEFPATSLSAAGFTAPVVERVFGAVALAFENRLQSWLKDGFAPVRRAWLERASAVGETIEVRLLEETFSGRFDTLSDTGELVVILASGERRAVASGEVYFGAV